MKTVHNDYWGYDIVVHEISDYAEGDTVYVKPQSFTKGSKVPQYLCGYRMKVVKIGRKNLKLSCDNYPGEFWYADPDEVTPAAELQTAANKKARTDNT